MLEESIPELPFGFIKLDEVGRLFIYYEAIF